MLKEILIYIFLWFIIRILAYKYVKYIDKKECLKNANREDEHFNKMLEMSNLINEKGKSKC